MTLPGSAVVLIGTAVDLTGSVGTEVTTAVGDVVMGAGSGEGCDLQAHALSHSYIHTHAHTHVRTDTDTHSQTIQKSMRLNSTV